MASRSEKHDSLKLIVEEQKRDYDYLLHIYNRIRATESVLLTATFGIITYLYYTAPLGNKNSISQRLSVPNEDYGKVIYFIAAGFFVYGFFKLMLNVFGDNPWETTYEAPKTDYTHTPADTIRYIKYRYDQCLKKNGAAYYKRKKELIFSFYCILISAIILIVIKTLN